MKTHGGLPAEEADEAAREAGRGALVGGARWGGYGLAVSGAGYALSPIYRSLTIQFKVFIQLGFMVLGGSLEADRRIRLYEARKRVERRWMRERYLWEGVEAEAGAEVVKPGGSASEGSTSEGDG